MVNWQATKHNLSLQEGRTLFKRPICGGMDDRGVMVDGTHEEIAAEVHRVIETIGAESFMLGADCTLPTDIEVSNIRAEWTPQKCSVCFCRNFTGSLYG